jgi:histidine ammonia-lyase
MSHNRLLCSLAMLAAFSASASAETAFNAITPTMVDKTITLTGKDLTIDQVIQVARYGAKVALSPEARQRNADRYGILLESAGEGITVYRLNRQAGAGRAVVTFKGDPLDPNNKQDDGTPVPEYLAKRELQGFVSGARGGYGPDISDEELVRAVLVVRANTMTYAAVSPPILQMMIDLLNDRIAPVIKSRGYVGEADLTQMGNIKGTMVGAGDCYYKGVRMPAEQALQQAGLTPVKPFGADNDTLDVTNSFSTAQDVLLVDVAKQAIDWADLTDAMDLNGMDSSITPLSSIVQAARPYKWLNWDANRLLDALKGSYLFDASERIVQDPESLRASSIRQASAWQAWAQLRDDVLIQINSSDNNPAVAEGTPKDSWELSQPHMMNYYVKGGKNSHGKSGFVFSNANWDPYPLVNDVESLTLAIGNMDIAVMLRQAKFASPFFTMQTAQEIMKGNGGGAFGGGNGGIFTAREIWQHIQPLLNPVTPEGYSADYQQVEELDSESVLKVVRARQVIDETMMLLAADFSTGARWMDLRKIQDPSRGFGPAPTAALEAYHKLVPAVVSGQAAPAQPLGEITLGFLKENPAAAFFPAGSAMPDAAAMPAHK